MDARITIEAPDNTRGQAQLSADRRTLMKLAQAPFFRRTMADEIPWVGCQFPTNAYAQEAGMQLGAFEDWFYGACLRTGMPRRTDAGYSSGSITADEFGSSAETDSPVSKGRRARSTATTTCPAAVLLLADRGLCGGNDPWCPDQLDRACLDPPEVRKGRVEASAEEGEAELLAALDMDEGARFIGELGIGCNTGITGDAEHPLRRRWPGRSTSRSARAAQGRRRQLSSLGT